MLAKSRKNSKVSFPNSSYLDRFTCKYTVMWRDTPGGQQLGLLTQTALAKPQLQRTLL